MTGPANGRAFLGAIAATAAIGGGGVAIRYQRLGLTLTHYDARGHLVVARRIIDSITPGWQQIGAVWLPLPHLLNMLPVQVDALYRTGGSAVAISVLAFAVATTAIAWIVQMLTGSDAAAIAGAAVFALNPNVLYLQATPMTEPLFLALAALAVAMLMDWCQPADREDGRALGAPEGRKGTTSACIGTTFALLCLTRFEGWPITACALTMAAWARWREGEPLAAATKRVCAIAVYPIVAVIGFVTFSHVVIGEWFVASGFFVPENKAIGDPLLAAAEIWWGTHTLSAPSLVVAGAIGAGALLVSGVLSRSRGTSLIALSVGATAVLPWLAFIEGHPFRIRYMVPLIAIEAVGAGVAAGLLHRARVVGAIVVLGLVVFELHPLDVSAPMVTEAQWDRPNGPVRHHVTDCLGTPRHEETIMASMGSLGHYMQEASLAGFAIHDFLHEGNGDIWLAALTEGPRRFAGWVLIEEKAQGGDMLARRAREHPAFLDGYSRVCEGAGLALYRRQDDQNGMLNTKR